MCSVWTCYHLWRDQEVSVTAAISACSPVCCGPELRAQTPLVHGRPSCHPFWACFRWFGQKCTEKWPAGGYQRFLCSFLNRGAGCSTAAINLKSVMMMINNNNNDLIRNWRQKQTTSVSLKWRGSSNIWICPIFSSKKQHKYTVESHIFLILEVQHSKKCVKMLYEYQRTTVFFFFYIYI